MSDRYYRLHDVINKVEKYVRQLRHDEEQGDVSLIDEMETIMKSTQQCKEEFCPNLEKAFSLIDKSEIYVYGALLFKKAGNVSLPTILVPASLVSKGTTQPTKSTPAAPIDRSSSSSTPDKCACGDPLCHGISDLSDVIEQMDKCLYEFLIQKVESQGVFGTVMMRILTRLRAARECLENLKTDYFTYAHAPMIAQYTMTPEELSSFADGTRCPANGRMYGSVAGLQRALTTLEKSTFDLLLRKFEELEKESLVDAIKKLRVGVDVLAKLQLGIFTKYCLYQNSILLAKSKERVRKPRRKARR